MARVAHQLRAAFGNGGHQFHQLRRAEPARDLESCEMVGGPASVSGQDALEARARSKPRRGWSGALSGGTPAARSAENRTAAAPSACRIPWQAAPPHRAPAAPGGCACGYRDGWAEARVDDAPHLRPQFVVRRESAPRQRSQQSATVAGSGLPVTSDRPPTSTRWQPISSLGVSRARRTASSNASPLAISVAAVRMPRRCASTIPALTSGVKPKSSALTTSCFRRFKIASAGWSGISWDWRACPWPATGTRAWRR